MENFLINKKDNIMEFSIENKVIVHYKYGYFGRIEIGDNPEAPEISFVMQHYCDDKKIEEIMLSDELIEPLIKSLTKYKESKGGN